MINQNTSNFHVAYMDVTKHWSHMSEPYSGGDALLTALYDGWEIDEEIKCEEKWLAGQRQILVFHVNMHRDGEMRVMHVLDNPYVSRMFAKREFRITPLQRSEAAKQH